jgi:hypothetical protein
MATGRAGRRQPGRREYGYTLLIAAVGAGLMLVALRRAWADVGFTPPRPLPGQVVTVSGQDLVPVAAALALAALACLAAVIATRGLARRIAGALLAVLGGWAGISALVTVSPAAAVSVAAGRIGSPTASAATGAAGSTTAGSTGSGNTVIVSGTATHVVMSGGGWRVLAAFGAVLIVVAGLAIACRTRTRAPASASTLVNAAACTKEGADSRIHPEDPAGPGDAAELGKLSDSAELWEALSRGDDPS